MTLDTSLLHEAVRYTGLISICLVLIGWRVVYTNALKVTTRAETKSLVDDATKILGDIEDMSLDYWLVGKEDRLCSDEFSLLFNAKLMTLHNRLEIIKNRKVSIENIDLALISTKVTFRCEDVKKMTASARREITQELLEVLNHARISLYDEFQKSYKPKFSFFQFLSK